MNIEAFSRPTATADRLGDLAQDRHRFLNKSVLLTGHSAVLKTRNGRIMFLAALRLLVRITRHLAIHVPKDCPALAIESSAIARAIAFDSLLQVTDGESEFGSYHAILSIGGIPSATDLPWTTISSNGWIAYIDSSGLGAEMQTNIDNPPTALAAACLGVTEVFKRLVQLSSRRGRMLKSTRFSLFNYNCLEPDAGPDMPSHLNVDLILSGAGAIGNGVAFLLRELPARGRILLLDRQMYGTENLGTCCLIGPSDINEPKADILAAFLRPQFDVDSFVGDIEAASPQIEQMLERDSVMLNALDKISARHHIQRHWPSYLIDGAIGDFMSQVSVHPWKADSACLMCLFREREQDALALARNVTGLNMDRIRSPESLVGTSDIEAAPVAKRAWLREHEGQKICSVIQAGIAQQISAEPQKADFEPSVPFVACLSAAMMVGELVKHAMGMRSELDPRFQMDVLHGPRTGVTLSQGRRNDCICMHRKTEINAFREDRVRDYAQ